jgi:hypothetical protein
LCCCPRPRARLRLRLRLRLRFPLAGSAKRQLELLLPSSSPSSPPRSFPSPLPPPSLPPSPPPDTRCFPAGPRAPGSLSVADAADILSSSISTASTDTKRTIARLLSPSPSFVFGRGVLTWIEPLFFGFFFLPEKNQKNDTDPKRARREKIFETGQRL